MDTENESPPCPNCGGRVVGKGRGIKGKVFCQPSCKTSFFNRQKGEGAILVPLMKAWMGNRHAPKGSREAEVCKAARREVTSILRDLMERDANHRDEHGNPAPRPDLTDYVERQIATSLYKDRTRK